MYTYIFHIDKYIFIYTYIYVDMYRYEYEYMCMINIYIYTCVYNKIFPWYVVFFYILLMGLGVSMLGFCIYLLFIFLLIRHLDFANIARWPLRQQHPQAEPSTTCQLPRAQRPHHRPEGLGFGAGLPTRMAGLGEDRTMLCPCRFIRSPIQIISI